MSIDWTEFKGSDTDRDEFRGRCIALTTEPGDLVLDPFVGSGTSGIAALHHQCRFIGIDVSQTYLSIAKERLTDLDRKVLR